jgi:hypothetical protein
MTSFLHARSAFRLPVLLVGLLFAQDRRRTVTSWLRAAAVGTDFPNFYYFLGALGRAGAPAVTLLQAVLRRIPGTGPLRFLLDDTPTQRYGPCVQGAGIHHNPSPGPADAPFLYGHLWVTLALLVRHPQWGPIGLPLRALLYVRNKDLPKVPPRARWSFRTKLQLAAELIEWAAQIAAFTGRAVEVVVDGAYAKKPFLQAARAAGVTVLSRLRKDAALCSVPGPRRAGQRGRTRTYGPETFSLAKRAGQTRGWQTTVVRQYGQWRQKRYKTFAATWRPAGGRIRVVLVQEESGWLAYFSTDPELSVEQLLQGAAERMAIEEDFHDLKEVEGLGQPQLRNIWANIGAVQLTLWEFTMVELWAWDQPSAAVCDRSASPWDDPTRRPSHADKRRALQRWCLRQEYQRLYQDQPLTAERRQFIENLLRRAA